MKNLLRSCLVVLLISTAHAADKLPLRIGWTAWSDAEAVTRLAARILESRLDQPVELVLLDIGIQYQGLANGDIDAMLMAWLPLTHKPYMDKVGDRVVNLGPLYTRARLGWVVPDYVPKDQLNSIEDLKDRTVMGKLNNQIHGIDPGAGLMQASEKVIENYELDRYHLISSSGAGMTAALSRAIKRQNWIVVTGWSPHWMFGAYDLRYLEDPKGVLGKAERVHAYARSGFYQDHIEAAAFLSRMQIPLADLQQAMHHAQETSYEKAVEKYMQDNEDRIGYWVSGEL